MNILIVTRWFYPANTPRAFRATELAKEMSSRGHKVTVLTIKDEKLHDAFSSEFGFEIIDLGKLTWKLPVFGHKGIGFLITRAVHRFFSLFFEYPTIELMYKVQRKLQSVDQFDLLISVAVPYPIHWGVAKARSKKYPIAKTWIADCGDPYMGDKTDSFRKLFYFKYVEKWFMRKADYITIPVEEGKGGYYQEFHHKIHIIPQGFKFKQNQETNYVQNTIPTFAYAGAFIPGVRDPRKFLEFLKAFNGDFVFIVYTQSQHVLQPYITPLADKLILKDYIPREQLLVELGKMDFLVNFDNNTGVQQPSKLIDYTLTGRPIINIYGELDEKVILEFLAGNYENSYKTPNMDKYKIENVVDMFLSLAK